MLLSLPISHTYLRHGVSNAPSSPYSCGALREPGTQPKILGPPSTHSRHHPSYIFCCSINFEYLWGMKFYHHPTWSPSRPSQNSLLPSPDSRPESLYSSLCSILHQGQLCLTFRGIAIAFQYENTATYVTPLLLNCCSRQKEKNRLRLDSCFKKLN